MPQHCEQVQNFASTPEFQSFAFHTLTCIEIPIHLFASYVILFKTPAKMKSVKWAMFNLHFWTICLDISLSFLTIPYILFPTTSGYGLGFLMTIGVDPAYQTAFVVAEIGFTVISIMVLFENQYLVVTRAKRASRWIRRFIAFCYLFAATYFLPFVYMVPEQSTAVVEILESLPNLRCFYSGPVFVMTQNARLMGGITILKLLVEFAAIGVLVYLTLQHISSGTGKFKRSQATLTLQKRLFIKLLVQMTIPTCVIFLPIAVFIGALFKNYFNQAMNNICFLIISCHGLISTLALLLVHEPYRTATVSCFRAKPHAKLLKTASSSFISIKPVAQLFGSQ